MSWTLSGEVIVQQAIGDSHFATLHYANYQLHDRLIDIIMGDGSTHSNISNKIHLSVLKHKNENKTLYKSINYTGMSDIYVTVRKIYF